MADILSAAEQYMECRRVAGAYRSWWDHWEFGMSLVTKTKVLDIRCCVAQDVYISDQVDLPSCIRFAIALPCKELYDNHLPTCSLPCFWGIHSERIFHRGEQLPPAYDQTRRVHHEVFHRYSDWESTLRAHSETHPEEMRSIWCDTMSFINKSKKLAHRKFRNIISKSSYFNVSSL